MSITTKRGDGGETGLAGGIRTLKSDSRVEAYGSIDELNTVLGFARAHCDDAGIAATIRRIQKELFAVGSALATPPESSKKPPVIEAAWVDSLGAEVERIEKEEVLSDWSIPGEHPVSASFDIARTVCRRAERAVVRFRETGGELPPNTLAYLNRLSDVLWLFGRLIEKIHGIEASLRDPARSGPKWSRAW